MKIFLVLTVYYLFFSGFNFFQFKNFNATAHAEALKYSGNLTSFNSYVDDDIENLLLELNLQLKYSAGSDSVFDLSPKSYAFAEMRISHDAVTESQSQELRAGGLMIQLTESSTSFFIGKQIFLLGKNRTVNIVDGLGAYDYRFFLTRDKEDIKEGIYAAQLQFRSSGFKTQLLAGYDKHKHRMPELDSPWCKDICQSTHAEFWAANYQASGFTPIIASEPTSSNQSSGDGSSYTSGKRNQIYAAIISLNAFEFLDLGLYYFYAPSREPLYARELDLAANEVTLSPYSSPTNTYGLDFEFALDSFLFRGEAIHVNGGRMYIDPTHPLAATDSDGLIPVNQEKYSLGVEYKISDFYAGVEGFRSFYALAENENDNGSADDFNILTARDESLMFIYFRADKLWADLSLEHLWGADFGGSGGGTRSSFQKASLQWANTDAITTHLELIQFAGENDGLYGSFKDNDTVQLMAKCLF